jgi:hypothetical protein
MSVLQGYQNSYMKVQGSMIMLAWVLQKILYSPKTAEKTIQDHGFDFGFFWSPPPQILGVITSTIGVAISLKKFDALNDHMTHTKLGVAIMVLVWVQVVLSIIRPKRYYYYYYYYYTQKTI